MAVKCLLRAFTTKTSSYGENQTSEDRPENGKQRCFLSDYHKSDNSHCISPECYKIIKSQNFFEFINVESIKLALSIPIQISTIYELYASIGYYHV